MSLIDVVRESVGARGAPRLARDPVNQAMIRHWCDAMEDGNPVYTDPEAAAKSLHGEIVAPPTMLNAWLMPGLVGPSPASSESEPFVDALRALDAAGFTSVVATNCEHVYDRYLRLGDHLTQRVALAEVSDEKQTALGRGYFVTTETEYRDQDGERVGTMLLRILKFAPGTGRVPAVAGAEESPAARPRRPRPGVSRDTRFFWDGLARGELRIQSCRSCDALHHPPVVRCPGCGSYDLSHQVACGRGHVYSFVEVHHPQVPAFDYPLTVAVVELEEGTRLISNVIGFDPEKMEIGMPVELAIVDVDPELALPLFRPRRPERRLETLRFEEVGIGEELAACPVPITTTRIVAGAIASRDYQDVHHDRDLAIKRGSPDVFMNILTSGGLCGRYISDWAGPEALLRRLEIRLGAPNHPGDCMILSGRVSSKELRGGHGVLEVEVRGANRLGDHVSGTLEVELPTASRATRMRGMRS